MTRSMTATEHGVDLTIHTLANDSRYSTHETLLGGPFNSQRWSIVESPIWLSSVSRVGRGTAVWKVNDALRPEECKVLKEAWCHTSRCLRGLRSQDYASEDLPTPLPGFGLGVCAPTSRVDIIVARVRGKLDLNEPDVTDANHTVAHRIIIGAAGCSLWEYRTELELLKSFRAVLAGDELFYYPIAVYGL